MFFSISKPLSVSKPIVLASLIAACFTAPAMAQEQNEGDLIPVIVTASRIEQSQRDAIASTSVITREKIEKSKATDLPELLQKEAGVSVNRNGGPGSPMRIHLRGADAHEVLILIDGIPMTDANQMSNYTPINLQNIMPEQIEQVEVVRGNVSAIYGSGAIGGVINIITRQAKEGKPHVSASAEIGTNTTTKLSGAVAAKIENTKVAFSATRFRTNGITAMNGDQMGTSAGPNGDKDSDRNISFAGNISHEWSPGQEFGLRLYGYDAKVNYDSNSTYPAHRSAKDKHRQDSRQSTIAAWTKNKITSDWTSTLTASHTEIKRKHFDSGNALNDQVENYVTETSMLQWSNQYALNDDWIVTAGADFKRDQGKMNSYGDLYTKQRNSYDVFAGLSGKYGSHNLQLNARYDNADEAGSRSTGYLGYGFDVTDQWKLIANVSTAFLAPDLYQQYTPYYGNLNLKPEKSTSYEGGIQYSDAKTLVRLTAFETKTRDMIDYKSTGPYTGYYDNIHRVKNKGLELNGQTQVFGLDINGNITLQDPKNRDTGKQLGYRAKKLANLDVSKDFGRWYVGSNVHYEKERPFGDRGRTLASYALVNFNVRYKINDQFELFGRIDNLFDRDYQTTYGYNEWGRAFFGGVNWKM